MGKVIVVIVIVAAIAAAWHLGYIGKWTDAALDSVDSGASSMRNVQREVTQKRGD